MADMPRGEMTAPPTTATEMPVGVMQQDEAPAAGAGSAMPNGNGAAEMPAGTMPNGPSGGDMPGGVMPLE